MGWSWQGFAAGWNDPQYAARVMEQRAKEQAEAERQQRFATALERMSGGAGGSNYQSALNELALSDPRFATLAVENLKPMSPLDDLQLQKNRLEVENMRGERDQKAASEAAARRALGIGGQPQTPNFNPALGNQPQPSSPDYSALSQLGIPQADNINSRSSENLGLPNPSDIQAMAQQLLQARTQGAPSAPVTQEALPTMAAPPADITQQPVVPQTAPATAHPAQPTTGIMTPQEWASRPENQPMIALGPVEAAKAYNEFLQREQQNADKLAEEQRNAESKSVASAAEAQASARMMQQASEPVFNNIIDTVDVLLGNKEGLEHITGQWSLLPFNIQPESRSAEANLSALKENLSVERLQQIKAAGFAPGTITEREWPRFENALVNLKNSQTYPEMVRNLNRLKEVTTGVQNIQRRAAGLPELEKPSNDDPLGFRGGSQADPLGIR